MDPAIVTLTIIGAAIVLFIWEIIPLALTAMLAVVAFTLTGVLSPSEAFASFSSSTVVLVVALFVLGGALFETGMAARAGNVITRFANGQRQLIAAIMLVAGITSGFLSNTGTAAVLIPVVIGIAIRTGLNHRNLLMPLAFASSMGGNLSLIGSTSNLLGDTILRKTFEGVGFSFFSFAMVGLPILLLGMCYMIFFGHRFKEDRRDENSEVTRNPEPKSLYRQYGSLIVLALTVLGMLLSDTIGLPIHIIAVIGALFVVLVRVVDEKEVYRNIDLRTIFILAGLLPMSAALQKSGAGEMIANHVVGWLGGDPSPFILLNVLFLLTAFLSQFMSNTAAVGLMAPIGGTIAVSIGADPMAVIMAVVIGGSCAFLTPLATSANTMILGVGNYRFGDFAKAGWPLMVIAYLISILLLPVFFPFYP